MEPVVTNADIRAVHEYMKSGGWLTEFHKTRLFEKKICEYTGARFCVSTPNGTLALFLALAACGVSSGDRVIVPDLTMAATASSVILAGAEVVFVDIEPTTLCLDLDAASEAITSRTKAVILVSLNGRAPAGFAAFVSRCRSRGIKVIEDAAQSLGSFAAGRHLGTIGDCGCFSFSSQKIVNTGQGGAVVTDDEIVFEKMCLLRDFGRKEGGSDHYTSLGWNLKFTDLQAVVGIEQMRRLPQMVEHKRRVFDLYRERLAALEKIQVPATDLSSVTPWFVDILVDDNLRTPLTNFLRQNGVGSRMIYPPLHGEPAFATSGSFPVAEDISTRGLWLPSSLNLQTAQIERVCELIHQFMTK